MKKQLFLDGNKRTAVIFANHILISHSKGLIVIPAELVSEYKKLLIDYYEDKSDGENNNGVLSYTFTSGFFSPNFSLRASQISQRSFPCLSIFLIVL